MKLYTGLDIHKKTIYGTMVDENGKIIDQRNFDNDEENLKEFLCGRPTKIVIEACGFWMDIYDKLTSDGYEVVLAHPLRVQAIASAKMKSDKIDSEVLANLLRGNLIPEAWPPSKEVREQRDLVRFRSNLVRSRTRLKNRIKAVLLKEGIKTDRGLAKVKIEMNLVCIAHNLQKIWNMKRSLRENNKINGSFCKIADNIQRILVNHHLNL